MQPVAWHWSHFVTKKWKLGKKYSTSWWLNQPIWKICASQIGSFPQFSGSTFQKYLSCHHLVQECVLNMLKILTPLECLFWFNGIGTTFCRLENLIKSISCTHPQKQGKLWQSLPWVISTPNHQKKGRYGHGCFTDICHLHGKCQVDLGLWSEESQPILTAGRMGDENLKPKSWRGKSGNLFVTWILYLWSTGWSADRLYLWCATVASLWTSKASFFWWVSWTKSFMPSPKNWCWKKSHDNAYALRVCVYPMPTKSATSNMLRWENGRFRTRSATKNQQITQITIWLWIRGTWDTQHAAIEKK